MEVGAFPKAVAVGFGFVFWILHRTEKCLVLHDCNSLGLEVICTSKCLSEENEKL